MGEKVSANPVTGTGSLTVPVPLSQGRSGFGPNLVLGYDSGRGNGPFGLGWGLSIPAVTRKTDKGLPRYDDCDVFLISDAEDLVAVPGPEESTPDYRIAQFRPRIEGLFARIERWTRSSDGDVHWRSISRDNVTTLYGTDTGSRITDPATPQRVFSWLVSGSFDDKGNAIAYEYAAEDGVGVDLGSAHEQNRPALDRTAGRYLKRIRYGNRVSLLNDSRPAADDWMFEVVLDYGEHDTQAPTPSPSSTWPCRQDPFSAYRAGFEVRSYRLCRRILMFHSFPDEPDVRADCLVRSLDLSYRDAPDGTLAVSVISRGYRRAADEYVSAALPPIEFDYSEATLHDEVQTADPAALENLPAGVSGGPLWVDLDGEGISGVLIDSPGAWYYKANLGGGRLAPVREVARVPAGASVYTGRQQLLDLSADGCLDLVTLQGPTPGFTPRTSGAEWERFTPFESLPTLDWSSENLRFVDLDGDGLADVLLTEDGVFTWYTSQGERGFATGGTGRPPWDDERGPRLVFADGTRSVYLADMSGDGLIDLVRITNGAVCYWPNLGYGRFGAKVTMDAAPVFDDADLFDQQRVRLIDVDGNGLTDLIYLGAAEVSVYVNQSGNAWSERRRIPGLSYAGDVSSVTALDLLGTGTACLVWSSAAPYDAGRQLRYVDLLGDQKPHLLTGVRNNLGAETRISYTSSTTFYLADAAAGQPWVTRLPFPVHVVQKVETIDHIGRSRLVARYSYAHGYFDGIEREFRGFGRVDQWDVDQVDAVAGDAPLPAILTRTWHHTGAFVSGAEVSRQFAGEYWHEPELTAAERDQLAARNNPLPTGLSTPELIEACRALKGSILRQETYALDGSTAQDRPYAVTQHTYGVSLVQPRAANPHAVFLVHPRETVEMRYERTLYPIESSTGTHPVADPRITHTVILEVDAFGNVLRSAAIGYGRRHPDSDLDPLLPAPAAAAVVAEQGRTHAVLTVNGYTGPVDAPDVHRTPLPCEATTYELTGQVVDVVDPLTTVPLTFDEVMTLAGAADRRLLTQQRTYFRRDDLTGPLPLGEMDSLALTHEGRRLALTADLVRALYADQLTDPVPVLLEGGYVRDGDDWWIPTTRALFAPDGADELAFARAHFFQPRRFRDPFGSISTVGYDAYDLLPMESVDPLGNRVSVAAQDYRVLQPREVLDPNGNRSTVAFDVLGMVVGTALMGKPGATLGDTLDGFDPDAAGSDYLTDPSTGAEELLGRATTRMVYDLNAFYRTRDTAAPRPPVVGSLARETHVADLAPGEASPIMRTFSYSDGFGREIQAKHPAAQGGWVCSGWSIFDGKGRPVRQYEPFPTPTHAFEFARVVGVSPVLCYDPVGRVIATFSPHDCYAKLVSDAWCQRSWDVNDTIRLDPRTDDDVRDAAAGYLGTLPGGWRTWYDHRSSGELGQAEQDAATKAAEHAATPASAYQDSLGRTFLTVAHNRTSGTDELYPSLIVLDVQGHQREVHDALGRLVMRYDYDLAGRRVRRSSMEAGRRLTMLDIGGRPIRGWNSRAFATRITYDPLRRPLQRWVLDGSGAERLRERTVYGEAPPDASARNLRNQPHLHIDGAGLAVLDSYDVKGNVTASTRRLTRAYRDEADWTRLATSGDAELLTALPRADLTDDVFTSATSYDAMSRPTDLVTPDRTVTRHEYSADGLLNRVTAQVGGVDTLSTFVSGIDYDAHGRRTRIQYGNGVTTDYTYDPTTFRLTELLTTRAPSFPPDQRRLQDLTYTYDPVGNIIRIADDAQQTIFYNGHMMPPACGYTYDATYRLITATGREHIGQTAVRHPTWDDAARTRLPHPQDAQAMHNYTQTFTFDAAGNLTTVAHRTATPASTGDWTRTFQYSEPSQLDASQSSNRLSTSTVEGSTEPFSYDAHGNLTSMPHLPTMAWDEQDRLGSVNRLDGGGIWYCYDGSGERVRTVMENQRGVRLYERIYLGGSELYREYDGTGNTATAERETLHVLDDQRRIALVETRTGGMDSAAQQLVRFQLGNHLGSACIELDGTAALISYEEYHPYGTTSYQAVRSQIEVPKRYRYTGKQRDEETGFAYHGARYYATWLCQWISPDPDMWERYSAGGAQSTFGYCRQDPLGYIDPDGRVPLPKWLDRVIRIVDVLGRLHNQEGPVGHGARIERNTEGATRASQRHRPNISGGSNPPPSRVRRPGPPRPWEPVEGKRYIRPEDLPDIARLLHPGTGNRAAPASGGPGSTDRNAPAATTDRFAVQPEPAGPAGEHYPSNIHSGRSVESFPSRPPIGLDLEHYPMGPSLTLPDIERFLVNPNLGPYVEQFPSVNPPPMNASLSHRTRISSSSSNAQRIEASTAIVGFGIGAFVVGRGVASFLLDVTRFASPLMIFTDRNGRPPGSILRRQEDQFD